MKYPDEKDRTRSAVSTYAILSDYDCSDCRGCGDFDRVLAVRVGTIKSIKFGLPSILPMEAVWNRKKRMSTEEECVEVEESVTNKCNISTSVRAPCATIERARGTKERKKEARVVYSGLKINFKCLLNIHEIFSLFS